MEKLKKQLVAITQKGLLLPVLIGVLAINQIMIGSVSAQLGMGMGTDMVKQMFTVPPANAMTIVMPILNEDGKTTRLMGIPTITEVMSEPGSGDIVQDAMAVMMATGTPFYAPQGISFDDPVQALDLWGTYQSIQLSGDLKERYKYLTGIFTCNFCCGSPMSVTINGRCGCAHAQGARGFFKYMLSNYGDEYTNDQLVGEAYRWQAVWYPSGVVEDYLLATGRGDVSGHKPHGGAGSDGTHGILSE